MTNALLSVPQAYTAQLAQRLAGHTQAPDGSECWIWTGLLDRDGYGRISALGRTVSAHRASWLAYRGDLPEGLVIDHLCRTRACVNPWHLEPVTVRVNTRRGSLAGAVGKVRAERCLRGHLFSEWSTTRTFRGYSRRICLKCERMRSAECRARRKAG